MENVKYDFAVASATGLSQDVVRYEGSSGSPSKAARRRPCPSIYSKHTEIITSAHGKARSERFLSMLIVREWPCCGSVSSYSVDDEARE